MAKEIGVLLHTTKILEDEERADAAFAYEVDKGFGVESGGWLGASVP
jgi:hypothetical protein